MWSKSVKEAKIYETNYKASLQMIFEGEKGSPVKSRELYIETPDKERTRRSEGGVPSVNFSSSGYKYKGLSTSKYLQNDEEDDRLSNISEIFDHKDEKKFIKAYNN